MADLERGQRIRALLGSRPDLKQQDVADHVGVRLRSFQEWLAGGGIKWDHVKQLAALFDVDPEWIRYGENLPAGTPDLMARLDGMPEDLRAQLDRIEERQNEILNKLAALATQLDLRAKVPQTAAPEAQPAEATKDSA